MRFTWKTMTPVCCRRYQDIDIRLAILISLMELLLLFKTACCNSQAEDMPQKCFITKNATTISRLDLNPDRVDQRSRTDPLGHL